MISALTSKLKSKFNQGIDEHTTQRNFRLFVSIVTSVLAKLIAIGSTLITIPVTLNYLGAESFGVWMVISGVIAFITFSDLGLGMGLQNALSKSYGEDDNDSPKHYISNAYFISLTLVLVLLTVLYIAFIFLPIEKLFNIKDKNQLNDAVIALKYCLFAFLIGIPISLIQRVLGGLQKTYVANNVLLVGSLMSLCSIFVSVHFDLGIVGLSMLFVLSPMTAMLTYSLYFFYKSPQLRPRISCLSSAKVKPIISAGAWTVFVQIIYTAKMNVPTIIISATLGLLAVGEYSIAQKLTGVAASMIGMALQPLWTVYGEAYHRGDREWVENTLKKSLQIVLLLTLIAAFTFQFVGQWLITLWVGEELLPSRALIACFSLWMIAANINLCFAMVLNGTGHFKMQALFSSVLVCFALVLSYFLAPKYGTVIVIFTMFFISELLRILFFYREAKRVIEGMNYVVKSGGNYATK
jgi:O-antigen/teichoic acid export membrane protein